MKKKLYKIVHDRKQELFSQYHSIERELAGKLNRTGKHCISAKKNVHERKSQDKEIDNERKNRKNKNGTSISNGKKIRKSNYGMEIYEKTITQTLEVAISRRHAHRPMLEYHSAWDQPKHRIRQWSSCWQRHSSQTRRPGSLDRQQHTDACRFPWESA